MADQSKLKEACKQYEAAVKAEAAQRAAQNNARSTGK